MLTNADANDYQPKWYYRTIGTVKMLHHVTEFLSKVLGTSSPCSAFAGDGEIQLAMCTQYPRPIFTEEVQVAAVGHVI